MLPEGAPSWQMSPPGPTTADTITPNGPSQGPQVTLGTPRAPQGCLWLPGVTQRPQGALGVDTVALEIPEGPPRPPGLPGSPQGSPEAPGIPGDFQNT